MTPESIRTAFEVGQRAWPQVSLDFIRFGKHLRKALGAAPSWNWQAHAADLYLVCACVVGDVEARAIIDRQLGACLEGFLLQLDPDTRLTAHLASLTAQWLGGYERLGDYAGRGPLLPWLSICAARLAASAVRDTKSGTSRAYDVS